MDYTISNIPDSEREFSDEQMILIQCAYIMNDLSIHLGEDWGVCNAHFTPAMNYFKFYVIKQNFHKQIKFSLTNYKYQILQDLNYNKVEDSIGIKTTKEVADFLKNKYEALE